MTLLSTSQKLQKLRKLLENHQLDYYFVPSTDPHHNEYVPDYWQRRAWITGFTGSAGDALIGLKDAYLWTDSRYFLQAEKELDQQCFQLIKYIRGSTPSIDEWLANQKRPLSVAVDPKVISFKQALKLKEVLSISGGQLISLDHNLIDELWDDRPSIPLNLVRVQPLQYAGQSAQEKIKALQTQLEINGAEAHIVTMLDAIAWLLNIRGRDVLFNPLVVSYVFVTKDQATLFVDLEKISPEIKDYLLSEGIDMAPYESVDKTLQTFTGNVWLDSDFTSWWIAQQLEHTTILQKTSPLLMMKAIKNETEQSGMRMAHQIDALAVVKFLHWLDQHWQFGVTEMSVADQLDQFRREDVRCLDLSFPTISGFADHGAIIHYHATPETNVTIDNTNLYLVDSGGQYHEGTTDITRTVHLGFPTYDQKYHYTLVLKGHLALSRLVFPEGICGEQIDAIARAPLWQALLDYSHGTGHGVGCYLCVHEGPQSISPGINRVPLKPGMTISNEPGLYIQNAYGIRIENVCLIKTAAEKNNSLSGHGPFYELETLTLVPYCRKLILKELLTAEEIQGINNYHQLIYEILSEQLSLDVRDWLFDATRVL